MSTGRSPVADALPRTSFLTYFRTPNQSKHKTSCHFEGPPPPYTKCSKSPSLPRIPEDAATSGNEDEDDRCDSRDDHSCDGHDERHHSWGLADMFGLFCYALLVLVIVFNVDIFLSRWNPGSGLSAWSDGIQSKASGEELHFCLSQSIQETPTSRVWRYVESEWQDCTQETVTLHIMHAEEAKLLLDDRLAFGTVEENGLRRREEKSLVTSSLRAASLERADDLAEEGQLR